MQPGRDTAEHAACLVILPAMSHLVQRSSIDGALQKQGVAVMGQHARGAIARPPDHQRGTARFLFLRHDLQHGRRAVAAAHREQPVAEGRDGIAVLRELPQREMALEDHHCAAVLSR